MKVEIKLNDFSKDYLPFKFDGFWREGACFLRIVVKNGNVMFFCTQLPGYTGTSVTNAIESILEHAIRRLFNEKTEDGQKVVQFNESFSFIRELILGNKNDERLLGELRKYILNESIWIEHYPPENKETNDGSFSLVNFTESGEPIWNYIDIKTLENEFSAPNLFIVNYEELKACHTKSE